MRRNIYNIYNLLLNKIARIYKMSNGICWNTCFSDIFNRIWRHDRIVNLGLSKHESRIKRTWTNQQLWCLTYITVYPKKYAHGFVVLCVVVVMQSFIMNSHEVFIHIHQGCFAGTGAIVRLPQCQWSKPDGYGKISQCITTTKHSKAKTVCIFLGIYCIFDVMNAYWNA